MSTFLVDNVTCTKDGGDGFTVGNVYEVLEVNDVHGVENDNDQLVPCAFFKVAVQAGNSNFKYLGE